MALRVASEWLTPVWKAAGSPQFKSEAAESATA